MNLRPVEHFFPHFLARSVLIRPKMRKKCSNGQRFICTKVTSYKIYILVPTYLVLSTQFLNTPLISQTGRMALLVTLFLVLVNIFNTVTTNTPKAEGLTAIEAWMLSCILFVFATLAEYACLLYSRLWLVIFLNIYIGPVKVKRKSAFSNPRLFQTSESTPARFHSISGLKSRVLKLIFLTF